MLNNIEGFTHLTEEEINALVDAPALITILIAGADGEVDQEERTWSERLLRSRTYNKPKELNEFYRVVSEIFWVKLNGLMHELPSEPDKRNPIIAETLGKLNPVFGKLEAEIAYDLYHGFVKLAEETAKASGGFLRIGAIGPEEAKWMHLPMLNPIEKPAHLKSDAETEEESKNAD
ncbi:MAG: hypothetical protein KGS48_03145 [Bacteroidetes bacterium]|nr:hypothetical protein [Bacteroidota bacterium]